MSFLSELRIHTSIPSYYAPIYRVHHTILRMGIIGSKELLSLVWVLGCWFVECYYYTSIHVVGSWLSWSPNTWPQLHNAGTATCRLVFVWCIISLPRVWQAMSWLPTFSKKKFLEGSFCLFFLSIITLNGMWWEYPFPLVTLLHYLVSGKVNRIDIALKSGGTKLTLFHCCYEKPKSLTSLYHSSIQQLHIYFLAG